MQIPDFLEKAIAGNKTSLGEHPAFPPEDDDLFIAALIRGEYSHAMEGIDTSDRKELCNRLNRIVAECKQEETSCREALENLCSNKLAEIFNIPDDTINISGKIVEECDMEKYRMVPDSTPDFEFEDIDEMNYLSDKIYQRRMIDCLMSGITMHYIEHSEIFADEINSINPRLMNLYGMIFKYNQALLFNQADTIKSIEKSNSGRVTVNVGDPEDRIVIEAEGVIFPILLEYSIRGLLEVASLKGLPDDIEKADYIMGKTDYRLAENWDMRLGAPLWRLFVNCAEKCEYDVMNIGPNFIIMELSKLEPDVFNKFLQNVFKKTRLGTAMMTEFLQTIEYNQQHNDFDNFIQAQNDKYAINDSDEYTAEELLSEVDY